MKTKDFDYNLPEDLIAQYPLPNRSDARLLHYDRQTQQMTHRSFKDLASLLNPNDLLVFNNSFVIPARFYGQKETGGRVECLVERCLDDSVFLAHIRASKALKSGAKIRLPSDWIVEVCAKEDDLYRCRVETGSLQAMLDDIGHIPLPLYIERSDDVMDITRYQTIYAKHRGSVAAPTAGLHFDSSTFSSLMARGIQWGYVTLHVGAGTFRPVRVESVVDHQMHQEWFEVTEALCQQIQATKAQGGRVIAVGTTTLRSLESAAQGLEGLVPTARDTNIFIYPGFKFRVCDGLMTNFHLPKSTLLMLVAAFIGHAEVMKLYDVAVKERYRFYSYGDTSLLL